MTSSLQTEDPNGVHYALDRNGIVIDIGEQIEQLTGFKKQEIIGQNFRFFVVPQEQQEVCLHFQKALEGIFEPCEFKSLNKNGDIIFLRSNCRHPREDDKDAKVVGVLTKI